MAGGMRGRAGEHVWQWGMHGGVCVTEGSMHCRGTCVVGGMCMAGGGHVHGRGRACAWQGGHVWQGDKHDMHASPRAQNDRCM